MRASLIAAFRVIGLTLALVLQIAWLIQPLPLPVKILPASLCALSIMRPAAGLLVLAGLGPMANAISLWSQSPLPGIRLLEQLVLACVFGAGLRWWRPTTELRLGEAAALLAANAVASFIAVQPMLLLYRMPEVTPWGHLRALLQKGEYFLRSGLWDPLFFAALTVEGIALAVTTERIVRRHAAAADSTIRMAVVGHAGVAALNLEQVIGAAIRGGDLWRELPRIVRDVRVSLFYDVNAAGSVFLLNLLAGAGLLKTGRRFRWEIVPLLGLIGLGLWVAGSRAALLMLAVTLVGLFGLSAWHRRGAIRWIAATAIAGILIVGSIAALVYPAARNTSIESAAAVRRIMVHTSLNMWRAAPVFGVGIGRFYEASSQFGADALRSQPGIGTSNENAHNYFLQVLGSEGLVGLGALLFVLAVVLVPAIRTERIAPLPLRRWLIAGTIGYLLTWLLGHPQLVPEAAFAFSLVLGVIAGLTPSPAPAVWRGLIVLAAAFLAMTGPFRAAQAIRATDLEHVAVGLSPWQPEVDGVRYRLAGTSFVLYLPEDGSAVDLPVRRAPGAPDPLTLTASVNGRRLYEVVVSGDAWRTIRLQLPKGRRRFAPTDFEITSIGAGTPETPALYVGKATRR